MLITLTKKNKLLREMALSGVLNTERIVIQTFLLIYANLHSFIPLETRRRHGPPSIPNRSNSRIQNNQTDPDKRLCLNSLPASLTVMQLLMCPAAFVKDMVAGENSFSRPVK